MAAIAAYNAFTQAESAINEAKVLDTRVKIYAEARAYYNSTAFSTRTGRDWSGYLTARGLYKHTRLIYNYVPQVIDFYIDNIWVNADNILYPSLVTPVANGASDDVFKAVAQIDQWTNWKAKSKKVKKYASLVGGVLIEIIDDLDRQKVTQKTVKADNVVSVELNDADDVVSYELLLPVYDKKAQKYEQIRKVVTKEYFAYFKDGESFIPEGRQSAKEVNPYKFCPAVWLRHEEGDEDEGFDGKPAFSDFDKLDNLNSLASHVDDFIHKAIESPKVVGTVDGDLVPIIGGDKNPDGTITPQDPRLNWVVLMAKGNASVSDLVGNLPLGEAILIIENQKKSFYEAYPELSYLQILRELADASGTARQVALTPAQNRLDRAAASYDQQLIKLRQMQIAIAGWRTRNGWQNQSDQQRNFAPFNLDSYRNGKLDFNLKRSLLIEQSESEREDLELKKANRAVAVADIMPRAEQMRILGKTDDEIETLMTDKNTEQEMDAKRFGKVFDAGLGLEN